MRLLVFAPLLVLLSGCETTWQWPIVSAKHIELTMVGVTISWPLVLAAFAVVVLVLWVKAKIRGASKRGGEQR